MKQEFQNLVSNAKASIEQMDYIIAGPQGEGYVKNVINSITIALQHNNALYCIEGKTDIQHILH